MKALLFALVAAATLGFGEASPTYGQSGQKCTPGPRVIAGRECRVDCNVDHPGGDFANLWTGSFELCALACGADPYCVTAQYHKSDGFW